MPGELIRINTVPYILFIVMFAYKTLKNMLVSDFTAAKKVMREGVFFLQPGLEKCLFWIW